MFVVKPRITLCACVLIILSNVIVVHTTLAWQHKIIACVALACLAVIPPVSQRLWGAAIMCVLTVGLSCWHFLRTYEQVEQTSLIHLAEQQVSCYGTVYDTKLSASGKVKYCFLEIRSVFSPQILPNRGRLLLLLAPNSQVSQGDHIVAKGVVEIPAKPRYRWDFDLTSFLSRYGAIGELKPIVSLTVIPAPNRPWTPETTFAEMRSQISRVHAAALGRRYGDLVTSMVIGNRNVVVDESVSVPFRNLGLSHMLAASGFNLSVVVAAAWVALRPLIRQTLLLNLTAGVLMFFYSGLAGLSPSIQRAAVMCAAMLIARSFLRTTYLPAILSLTLAGTLLCDIFALSDVGLQLSYAATAALVCTGRLIMEARNVTPHGALRYLIEVTLSCITAICSVLPLQLYYFWQIGLLSLPANAMISPVVPIITVEGFVTSGLACMGMSASAKVLDQLIAVLVHMMMFIVDWLNSFDWALLCTGPPDASLVGFYYLNLWLLLTCRSFNLRAKCCTIGLLISIWLLIYRPPLPALTVVRMQEAVIAIDADRNALVAGPMQSMQVRRCIAYFGCRPINASKQPTGSNARIQWECRPEGISVILRATHKQIKIRPAGKKPLRHSIVREYG